MKRFISLIAVVMLSVIAFTIAPNVKRIDESHIAHAEPIQTEQTDVEPQKEEEPVKTAVKTEEPPKDPNGCEAKGMYYRADNNECIPKQTSKPKATSAPQGASKPQFTSGSGSCEAEIAKYNWSHSVATAVARAESGLNPGNLNNTPSTGDYSVGCFQINIFGANARSRPSEAELKKAHVNVAFAYRLYVGAGGSFKKDWRVCDYKVSCY